MAEPHSLIVLHDEKDFGDTEEAESLRLGTGQAPLANIVWRKFDKSILPLCACLYLLANLDRNNIANARIAGLQRSLAMSNYEYTVALTLTYVSYTAAEFPSNLLLKRIGPNIMLPALAILWGVVSASQGVVHNFSGLAACRFFLGLLEGGLPPGILLYLSFFYPRKALQTRVTIYFTMASFAGAFSGLLAAAIDELNGKGGKPGWAWIFILEGIISFVFGVMCFFFLPRAPENARFLTEKERLYVISALKQAGSVSEDDTQDQFSWKEVARAAKSPHMWLLAVVLFFNGAVVFGLAYFEPTIVASLGYSGNEAQLMSVPPYATAVVVALIMAVISDRYQCRGYTIIFFSVLQVIGFSMFYASYSKHIRYASLFFSVPGAYGQAAALLTWLVNNVSPHTRRAASVAVCFMMTELGGILSTWLLGWLSAAPNYTAATITFIAMSVGMVVFSTANLVYLWRENRKKIEKRQTMRKEDEPEGLGDRSAWFVYNL